MSTPYIQQLYRSRIHILEMMKSLGYNTEDYEDFSLLEVDTMATKDMMDMLLERSEPTPKRAFIKYFNGTSKMTPSDLNSIIDDLYDINQLLTAEDVLILITNQNISDTFKENIQYLFDHHQKHVIVHDIRYLQFNGLKHRLVPEAHILTEEEKEQFMKEYFVKDVKKQLPELDRFDAQAKLICARPGDVVRFKRMSQTAMESVYFRVCV